MLTNFLSLPGEIRNEIYRYLLVAEKRLIPWKDGYDLSLSIIATTKKLQIETSSILYGDNTFFLTPGYPERDRPETFFETIGLVNAGLRALGLPLLLARHERCLLWTAEGFEAARAAFPDATCITVADKPSVSDEFAEALRRFYETLPE